MSLVEQALLPDLLQRPPFRFNEIIFIRNVGMFHVGPESHHIRKFLPHPLILPNRLPAFLDKRFDPIGLNLLFSVDTDGLLHFELHRQAVGIPACLTQHLFPFHGLIAGQHILNHSR